MIKCPYMGMLCGADHAERDPKAAMDEAFAAQSYVYIQTEAEAQARVHSTRLDELAGAYAFGVHQAEALRAPTNTTHPRAIWTPSASLHSLRRRLAGNNGPQHDVGSFSERQYGWASQDLAREVVETSAAAEGEFNNRFGRDRPIDTKHVTEAEVDSTREAIARDQPASASQMIRQNIRSRSPDTRDDANRLSSRMIEARLGTSRQCDYVAAMESGGEAVPGGTWVECSGLGRDEKWLKLRERMDLPDRPAPVYQQNTTPQLVQTSVPWPLPHTFSTGAQWDPSRGVSGAEADATHQTWQARMTHRHAKHKDRMISTAMEPNEMYV